MKVAFVTNRPAHYRVPIFRLLARTRTVDFMFTATSDGRWWTKHHQVSADGLPSVSHPTATQLYKQLVSGQYDAVITGLGGRSHLAATAAAATRGRLPLITWVDMWHYPRTLVHALGRPLARRTIHSSKAIVTCGTHVTAWLEAEGWATAPVFEMPNAVDNEHFSAPIDTAEIARFRAQLGLDGPTVCFVGRLEAEKGLDCLLDAVHRSVSGFKLLVVGAGSAERRLRESAMRLGLASRVVFVDWIGQAELPKVYRASDLLVLPSITTRRVRETWGLAANEAMCAGLPVVATDAVGAAAGGLVVDGETGWVVPERNPEALSRALDRAVESTPLRLRLGEEARRRVATFTFTRAAATFDAALAKALKTPGQAE